MLIVHRTCDIFRSEFYYSLLTNILTKFQIIWFYTQWLIYNVDTTGH